MFKSSLEHVTNFFSPWKQRDLLTASVVEMIMDHFDYYIAEAQGLLDESRDELYEGTEFARRIADFKGFIPIGGANGSKAPRSAITDLINNVIEDQGFEYETTSHDLISTISSDEKLLELRTNFEEYVHNEYFEWVPSIFPLYRHATSFFVRNALTRLTTNLKTLRFGATTYFEFHEESEDTGAKIKEMLSSPDTVFFSLSNHSSHLDEVIADSAKRRYGLPHVAGPANTKINNKMRWLGAFAFDPKNTTPLYLWKNRVLFHALVKNKIPIHVYPTAGRSYSGKVVPNGITVSIPDFLHEAQEKYSANIVQLMTVSSFSIVPAGEDEYLTNAYYEGKKKKQNFLTGLISGLRGLDGVNQTGNFPVSIIVFDPVPISDYARGNNARQIRQNHAENIGLDFQSHYMAQGMHIVGYAISQIHEYDPDSEWENDVIDIKNLEAEVGSVINDLLKKNYPIQEQVQRQTSHQLTNEIISYFKEVGYVETTEEGDKLTEQGIRIANFYGNGIDHCFGIPKIETDTNVKEVVRV